MHTTKKWLPGWTTTTIALRLLALGGLLLQVLVQLCAQLQLQLALQLPQRVLQPLQRALLLHKLQVQRSRSKVTLRRA